MRGEQRTDWELLLELMRGTCDPVTRGRLERRLVQEAPLRQTRDWLRETLEAIAAGPVRVTPGAREALRQEYLARFGSASRFDVAFTCSIDSWAEPAPSGARGSHSERFLRYTGGALTVDLVWRPAPDEEPGVLIGRIDPGTMETSLDALEVEVVAGEESPLRDRATDGGHFVIRDVPALWPMRVSIIDSARDKRFRAFEIPRQSSD